MITTRPTQSPTIAPPANHTNYPSLHAIDDEVIFVPACQIPNVLLAQGVTCKVMGVTFVEGKVLYDLALPIDMFEFYEEFPLQRVDSVFVFPRPTP